MPTCRPDRLPLPRRPNAAPADDFLFLPPQLPHASGSNASASSSTSSSSSAGRFKSSSSPVLVLPEASRPAAFGGVGLGGDGSADATFRATRDALLWSLGASFLSSFVAQPFETGKVLSQIQYLPRRSFATLQEAAQRAEGSGTPEVEEMPEDDDDAQAFFEDLVAVAASKPRAASTGPAGDRRQTDAEGYVLRRGSDGDEPRDEWVMKRGYSGDGPWAMTKRLWNDEGPGAPWKGTSGRRSGHLRCAMADHLTRAGLALSYLLLQLSSSLPSLISSTLSPMYTTNPSVRAPTMRLLLSP
jgi:hypothetical protein